MKKFMIPALAAIALMLPLVLSATVQAAAAKMPWSAAAVDSALEKGCSVFLEFSASW